MALFRCLAIALTLSFSSCYLSTPSSATTSDGFLQCLSEKIPSELIFTPDSSNLFNDVLVSTIRNLKFLTNTTVKPICVVTVTDASHAQAAVQCGRMNGVRLRVRSGGHDYEGLSYLSKRPEVFGVIDLAKLRAIAVSTDEGFPMAWVDSGATIGELYYTISKNNPEVAFPAGTCPTIGVGGHFRGGGMGMLLRKYGLSIDNVVDAKLVNANGNLLDRMAMGEDLFWAIRGGGGESFGIVVSWKVSLVKVPSKVTVFNIAKPLDQGTIDVLTKWQHVAPALPSDIIVRVMVQGQQAIFQSLFLGTCDELVPTMTSRLPELNVTKADCSEMSWLESAAFINFGNNDTAALLNRSSTGASGFVKIKSDYVRRAIPKGAWKKIFSLFRMDGAGLVILEPHGGFVGTIPASATPYPHRSGVLYNIQYIAFWSAKDDGSTAKSWVNNFYDFMGQYVTKSPRGVYVNYRDLDIGENVVVNDMSTFDSGKVWGEKYFGGNFQRLAAVKRAVDPTDYFRNEQSIPPLPQCN
ncbi:hypothetical protein EJB05_41415, partial [Eragrostis curvula]